MITVRTTATEEDRQFCYNLRSEMYRRHYENVPAGGFSDSYDSAVLRSGQPQSLVVLAECCGRTVGTLRSTIAWDLDEPTIRSDATALMDVELERPGELERIVGHEGSRLTRVVELNKMAVLPADNHRNVLRSVFAEAARFAWEEGVLYTLGIATPIAARSLRIAGMHYRRVPSVRLRRETSEQVRYLVKYSGYFLRHSSLNTTTD